MRKILLFNQYKAGLETGLRKKLEEVNKKATEPKPAQPEPAEPKANDQPAK